MKIAIIGYGKMGKAIEQAALANHDEVGLVVDSTDELRGSLAQLKACDVAIEFSTPATAPGNVALCLENDVPVVVGTTGWYDRLPAMRQLCDERHGSLFVASNFSIGMNIVFHIADSLSRMTHEVASYLPAISETHHIHKLDAPSGTAIQLANVVLEHYPELSSWQLKPAAGEGTADPHCLPIEAIREGEVAGIHDLTFSSQFDTITLRHEAKGRQGLVAGALAAARYLVSNPGYREMRDMLKF